VRFYHGKFITACVNLWIRSNGSQPRRATRTFFWLNYSCWVSRCHGSVKQNLGTFSACPGWQHQITLFAKLWNLILKSWNLTKTILLQVMSTLLPPGFGFHPFSPFMHPSAMTTSSPNAEHPKSSAVQANRSPMAAPSKTSQEQFNFSPSSQVKHKEKYACKFCGKVSLHSR